MIDRLIAKVKEVKEDWSITFEVPELFKEISTYPAAYPLFGTTQEVCEDDVVCIFYNYEYKDAFYYTKVTQSNYVGVFNKGCEMQMTDGENIIVNSKGEIRFNGDEDYLTMYQKLEDALKKFDDDLNNALKKYAMKMTQAWTALNATYGIIKPLSPDSQFDKLEHDISKAKAESLRTSGPSQEREEDSQY